MKKSVFHFCMIALLGGMLLTLGCKGGDRPLEAESQTVLDNALAESEFAAIRNIVDMEARSDTNLYPNNAGRVNNRFCTWGSTQINAITSSRFSMVVDFEGGTNCQDGRLRTGKLNVEFVGLWDQAGTVATVTAENYTSSGEAMEFTQVITYLGQDGEGRDQWTSDVTDGRLYTELGPIGWDGENTFTQIEGQGTEDLWDNRYEIEGTATGTARNTLEFTTSIIDPLVYRLDCRHIVGGTTEIVPNGFQSRTLAYGANTCDNLAILTIGDWFAEIALPQ